MEALFELVDLIAANPEKFSDKLSYVISRCPQPDLPRITRSHLNSLLALARLLSNSPFHLSNSNSPKVVILAFLLAVPTTSFSLSFWPQPSSLDMISAFFSDFLNYVAKAAELDPGFGTEVGEVVGEILVSVFGADKDESGICKVFLMAVTRSSVPIFGKAGECLIVRIIDELNVPVFAVPASPVEVRSEVSSVQSSPISVIVDSTINNSNNNDNGSSASNVGEISSPNEGSNISSSSRAVIANGGSYGNNARQHVGTFEEESVESLEKQEIAYKLIAQILDKVRIDNKLLEQVRLVARKQLQSMPAFLKVRRKKRRRSI